MKGHNIICFGKGLCHSDSLTVMSLTVKKSLTDTRDSEVTCEVTNVDNDHRTDSQTLSHTRRIVKPGCAPARTSLAIKTSWQELRAASKSGGASLWKISQETFCRTDRLRTSLLSFGVNRGWFLHVM